MEFRNPRADASPGHLLLSLSYDEPAFACSGQRHLAILQTAKSCESHTRDHVSENHTYIWRVTGCKLRPEQLQTVFHMSPGSFKVMVLDEGNDDMAFCVKQTLLSDWTPFI